MVEDKFGFFLVGINKKLTTVGNSKGFVLDRNLFLDTQLKIGAKVAVYAKAKDKPRLKIAEKRTILSINKSFAVTIDSNMNLDDKEFELHIKKVED